MAKTRGGIVKRSIHKPSKNKKRKAEEVSRSPKKKKIVVEEPKSNSNSDTMDEIDNYEDSNGQATDDVESSEEKTDSGDEETLQENESSRDSRDTGDEDDDPLSLPICAREICGKSYNLTTWMDELGSFPVKISVWIYEAFPHLGKYAKKSLDSPLPISRLLRWHTTKSDNIVKGDPFKYLGRSTKADLKGVTVLTSSVENVEDGYSSDHNPNKPCENYVPSTSKDESICERVASLEQSIVKIVAFVQEEKLRRNEKKKRKKVDDDNFSAPIIDDEILPLVVVDDVLVAVDAYFVEEVDEEMKEE
ncbi:hypothetical protein H5410_032858 [Solanum commersonii]|uniref:Uncharacterized protein n=1 Tax=Solanum commersonii TaxID=4109 RepID=A0A9J5YP40_SOLCO|nr:hypothetical protein H5410_032858 [Solanum commersonii]